MKKILPKSFYLREDPVIIAKELLGKYIFTEFQETLTGGMIVETEAYKAPRDRASHAFNYRRTKRNEAMYMEGGTGYVYTCYGTHNLFNVVTNEKEMPHAILIRAIIPKFGLETMSRRRGRQELKKLASGPGTLTRALGILKIHNALPLHKAPIWLEDRGIKIAEKDVAAAPRIGVEYAGEDAKLPWRFILK